MLETIRAVSLMDSPRLIWLSVGDRKTDEPPRCAHATSKEIRVRVEDFSKISTMVRKCSRFAVFGPIGSCFSAMARWMSAMSSDGERSLSVRKWRVIASVACAGNLTKNKTPGKGRPTLKSSADTLSRQPIPETPLI